MTELLTLLILSVPVLSLFFFLSLFLLSIFRMAFQSLCCTGRAAIPEEKETGKVGGRANEH